MSYKVRVQDRWPLVVHDTLRDLSFCFQLVGDRVDRTVWIEPYGSLHTVNTIWFAPCCWLFRNALLVACSAFVLPCRMLSRSTGNMNVSSLVERVSRKRVYLVVLVEMQSTLFSDGS